MARLPRLDPEGLWHHAMNRGARHQPIFGDDTDRMTFLGLLSVVHERFGVETQAYCLMGNHYHLMLRCPHGELSKALHYIGTVYTQKFNRKYDFDGALFRGRFHSIPVTTDQYLLDLSRYIHLNPTDTKLTGDLCDYRWSSYATYLGLRPAPEWLGQPLVMELMHNNAETYRKYVQTPRSEAELKLLTPPDDVGHTRRLQRGSAEGAPTLDTLEIAILSTTGATRAEIHDSTAGVTNRARLAMVLLAAEDTNVSLDQVATRCHLSGRGAVWATVSRARGRMGTDPVFEAIVSTVRALVHPGGQRTVA